MQFVGIKLIMINLTNCDGFSNATFNSSLVLRVKNILTVPSLLLLGAALFVAAIIQLALILSKCFKFPNYLLYFNLVVVDAIMAAAGILMVSLPTNSSGWLNYYELSGALLVLR